MNLRVAAALVVAQQRLETEIDQGILVPTFPQRQAKMHSVDGQMPTIGV